MPIHWLLSQPISASLQQPLTSKRRTGFTITSDFPDSQPPAETTQNQSAALIVDLSSALHTFGVAAHDLEESMTETAAALGITASFFATPTSIFISFGTFPDQQTTLLRVRPGDVNLEKLEQLYELNRNIVFGVVSVQEGLHRVGEILAKPARYGSAVSVLAFALATSTAAVIFGGGVEELLASLVIGALIGLLARFTSGHSAAQPLFLPAASLLASVIATVLGIISEDITSGIVTVSSLIILIPGLSLTIAMNELATQNLASGTARIAGSLSQLLIIGFGVALGRSVVSIIANPVSNLPGESLPLPMTVFSLFFAALAFTILFQAPPRDFIWIALAGFIAFFSSQYSVKFLGPLAGPSLAAAVLGCLSNMLSRWRKQPVSVTLVPGLLLLVPGSLGFRSISALLDKQMINSFESAFTMVLVAASIVAGLLFANLVTPPTRMLQKS